MATAKVGLVVYHQLWQESDQAKPPTVDLPTEITGYINPELATADYGVGMFFTDTV